MPGPEASDHAASKQADDVLARFANGELSRKRAMAILGVEYGEMIEMMADRGLSLPRVSDVEAVRMAKILTDALDIVDEPSRSPGP